MKKNITTALLLVAGISTLPGCVVVPAGPGQPHSYYAPMTPDYAQQGTDNGMVQVVYTPQPMDVVIVDLPPENFIYLDGWTYYRHRDAYGHWVNERYRRGDARSELREHQAILREVRARNGGHIPDRPVAFNINKSDASKSHLNALIAKKPQQPNQQQQQPHQQQQQPHQQQQQQHQQQQQQQQQQHQHQQQQQQQQKPKPKPKLNSSGSK